MENESRLLRGAGHEVEAHIEENPSGLLASSTALARATWNKDASDRVLARAQSSRADVVHVHNTWFALSPAVFPVLTSAGFPVVATLHNYRQTCVNAMLYRNGSPCEDCVGKLPWRGVIHRCYRDSATQSAAVAATIALHRKRRTWQDDVHVIVALTRFAADVMVRSGIPASLIEVKPNVVPDNGPRRDSVERSDRVLFVGRLTEEKGIRDLLAAWQWRPPKDLRLDIVGEGPLGEKLRPVPGVSLRGPMPTTEVARCMLSSRALVVPSRWYEGLPMVIVEALAAGLPVVVPDLGALPEIVGGGGLIYDQGAPDSLSQALTRLRDDTLVSELGAAARHEYERRYSESVARRQLLGIYALACERVSRA